MHTENTVYIHGPLPRIFQLAADIQDWPILLPHYRNVTVFDQTPDGSRKIVEMAAVREDFPVAGLKFPVRWRSVQLCEPEKGCIIFKHLAGVAVGMWVVWRLREDPWGRGICVSIEHQLTYPFGFLNGWFAKEVVGRQFVANIAGQTLSVIKTLVESENQI